MELARDARRSVCSCSPLRQPHHRAGILLASFSCALWCWPVFSSSSLPSLAVLAPIHGARHLHSMVLGDNTECVVADPTAAIPCSVMATGHRALLPAPCPPMEPSAASNLPCPLQVVDLLFALDSASTPHHSSPSWNSSVCR
jgi:hypothetical protein